MVMGTAQTQVFNERHELDIYLEMPAPYDENMLTFWNKNKQKLPKMATIAKIYYVYQQQAHLVSGLFPHLARLHTEWEKGSNECRDIGKTDVFLNTICKILIALCLVKYTHKWKLDWM